MRRMPLLADDMRAIRAVMNLNSLNELTYWALWESHWKVFMRSSNVPRPSDDKLQRWNPTRDTHVGRITGE